MDITFHAATSKPQALQAVCETLDALALPDANVYLEHKLALALERPSQAAPEGQRSALYVAFGGDGTILNVAAKAAALGIPALGVNIGRIGFLSEVEPHGVKDAIERWARGDFWLDRRMMLEAQFNADGREAGAGTYALNDVAIVKQAPHNVIYIEALINSESAMSCGCDGMLVSTPTGSTAYALSAGGPLMSPNMRAKLVQPICAHSLGVRAMVIDERDDVTLRLSESAKAGAQVFCDGRLVRELAPGGSCTVRTACVEAQLVRFGKPQFLARVRQKLFL